MKNIIRSFSSFSVNDLAKTKEFYQTILGLEVIDSPMGMYIKLPSAGVVFVYKKDDHVPASFTILNFRVENIDETVTELKSKNVNFEIYPDMGQDEQGIARGIAISRGPDIAWFKDPSGNIISVLQTDKEE